MTRVYSVAVVGLLLLSAGVGRAGEGRRPLRGTVHGYVMRPVGSPHKGAGRFHQKRSGRLHRAGALEINGVVMRRLGLKFTVTDEGRKLEAKDLAKTNRRLKEAFGHDVKWKAASGGFVLAKHVKKNPEVPLGVGLARLFIGNNRQRAVEAVKNAGGSESAWIIDGKIERLGEELDGQKTVAWQADHSGAYGTVTRWLDFNPQTKTVRRLSETLQTTPKGTVIKTDGKGRTWSIFKRDGVFFEEKNYTQRRDGKGRFTKATVTED